MNNPQKPDNLSLLYDRDLLRHDGTKLTLEPLFEDPGVFRSLTLLAVLRLAFISDRWHLGEQPFADLQTDMAAIPKGDETALFTRHQLRETLDALNPADRAKVVGVAWVNERREDIPETSVVPAYSLEITPEQQADITKLEGTLSELEQKVEVMVEKKVDQFDPEFVEAKKARMKLRHKLSVLQNRLLNHAVPAVPARAVSAYTVYEPILLRELSLGPKQSTATVESSPLASQQAEATGPSGQIEKLGRLSYAKDFQTIWIGERVVDLSLHQSARFCVRFLVENQATDADSAKSFDDEIDPYVCKNTGRPSSSRKIQDYFAKHRDVCRELLAVVEGSGRYYLKV
jgi:hypothetical protein